MTECNTPIGKIHSIETFGSVDGPGVRFVIFLKGCRMRCKYCHNPETWLMDGAEDMTADELIKKALRYKGYWGKKGGITVSGGEALLQIDFLIDLFTKLKARGIHTALDTSGNPFTKEQPFFDKFQKLMEVTDLFILDIKHIEEEKHKEITGHSNKNILEMATYLSEQGKDMWIRHVLVPGYTDSEEALTKLGDFIRTLKTVTRFEILPYHTLGIVKWVELGIEYPLEGVYPPTDEEIKRAHDLIKL